MIQRLSMEETTLSGEPPRRYADATETMEDPMRLASISAAALSALLLTLAPGVALAQVPPHAPGSICLTPQFWCWAQPPGPPGGPCSCPTPDGQVQGVLG